MKSAGLVQRRSGYSVEESVRRLEGLLESKAIKLFASVDHSGEAERAGLAMRPTKLLIFGNPAAGTPVMQAEPSAALDLPLKILVWEDQEGAVWLSWNDPEYLAERHGIPAELVKNLGAAAALAGSLEP